MTHFPNDPQYIRIFDTSLRDGEQSPGVALNHAQKIEIGQQLARLGVDVIEAGFPIASAGAIFHASMSSGKFQGMICPTTPTGTAPGNSRSISCAHPAW